MVPQKQFDHLIRSFSALPNECRHWQLVILGEGPERSKLEALIDEHEIGNKVCLPGKVENVSGWYEKAEIFVLSSEYEGFPNTLAEAMSYGLPTVSYDCDTGPSELIESGVNGFLVESNDEESLSRHILELIHNDRLRARIGKSAEQVRSTFEPREIMKLWTRLLLGTNTL